MARSPAAPQGRDEPHTMPPHAHQPHPMPAPAITRTSHHITPPHHAPASHHSAPHHPSPPHPPPHHPPAHHTPGVVLISQKPLEPHLSHGHSTIEPSEVGVIPPQFMSSSSLSSSFSAAPHRSLSPERPVSSTAHQWA